MISELNYRPIIKLNCKADCIKFFGISKLYSIAQIQYDKDNKVEKESFYRAMHVVQSAVLLS